MEAIKLLHYYKLIVSASIYELPHNTELIGTNWLNNEGKEAQTYNIHVNKELPSMTRTLIHLTPYMFMQQVEKVYHGDHANSPHHAPIFYTFCYAQPTRV